MEERLKNITIIFFVAVVMFGTAAFAKSSSTLLQEGLYAEKVDGDLDAAIKIYEKIIEDDSSERSHIAQAMYLQGMCYLKKQNEPKAEEVFGRLVANYSDQTKVIDKVKPLLEELGHADPAALMPPGTLIYIETGSPGKQIATILNMLKGTPYENPFALLGGGKSQQSPGDMMGALFNPSMMAEFKKIRGMGIGVTGVAQNNPPLIAVLYPGKSDALRGLILAGLGMVAKPGEPIEGMDTLRIQNMAGIAYDDKVIIIAQPVEQLTWAVKQYKGVTSEPTLASSNKSFTKISKKGRQENALTIWANVNDVYTGVSKVIPKEDIPPQVRIADGIADFKNIDDMLVSINIQEDGIAIEKSLVFKDGHQCIAYNMIRTPNLSKAGLESVPSDAVGLVSIALGDAESAQVAAASERIKNLTGLDIGREVFANIEQINIFALPPSASKSNVTRPPIAGSLGLAITSHNPQQTRQLLTQLLTVANLVTGQTDVGQTAQGTGKYQVALINNQPICCYMNHMNKTTVLSLDPDIVEASISAMKRHRSVYSAGPLKEAVSKLSPSTSKLVLVNVGGAIEVADSSLTAIYKNPQNPVHKTLAQLAKVCSKTSVQIGTVEQINNFSVRLNINKLPPLGNLLPLLMQLSQVDPTQKAVASKPEPRDGAIVGLASLKKWKWKKGVKAKSHKVYFDTEADQLGLLAEVEGSSYDELPHLEEGTRYYWRVDEIWDDGTVIKGNVWSFTTGKLVGWWKFDGNAKDSSGNGNDGNETGDPKYVAGKIGQAISFDGKDDHIIVGTNGRPTDTFSFGGWLKTSATHEIDPESISDWLGVNNQRYAFGPQNGGESNSGAGLSIGTNGISVYEHGNFYMPAIAVYQADIGNDWNHIMVVYNNKQPTIYLNGSAVRTGISSQRAIVSAPKRFGGMEYGYFEGLMDEVRIYNYALSEGEITTLCNSIRPKLHDEYIRPDLSQGKFRIAVTNSLWKVTKTGPLPGVHFSDRVQIDAAQDETESFQLVVIPSGKGLKDVRVKTGPLKGPEGSSHLSIVWHRVGYVKVAEKGKYKNRLASVGWWPDVLLPAGPFDVDANERQTLWCKISVPPNATSGTYHGHITISHKEYSAKISVELRVRGFRLPRPGTFAAPFTLYSHLLRYWYGKKASIETYADWCEFLGQYRITPKSIARQYIREIKTESGTHLDMSLLKQTVGSLTPKYYPPYSFGIYRISSPEGIRDGTMTPEDSSVWADKIKEEIHRYISAYRREGLPPKCYYIYALDEADPKFHHLLHEAYRKIKDRNPDVPIMQTLNPVAAEKLVGVVDIWCVQSDGTFHPFFKRRKQAGDTFWIYVTGGRQLPYAGFLFDEEAIDHRVLFWQVRQAGATGLLYHETIEWRGFPTAVSGKPHFPDIPIRLKDSFEKRAIYGDGLLIYPGPEMTPYPSLRLEIIRDGIEDYEYLALLEICIKKAKALPAGRRPSAMILKRAQTLSIVPNNIVAQSVTKYTKNPEVILGQRKAIGDMIECLMQALSPKK